MGDALQVWELALCFSEVLGLGQSFSFQELVSELVSPLLDSYLDSHLGRSTDTILTKIYRSLLKLLVSELLSKLAAFTCFEVDSKESKSKSRRGKKKDSHCLAALRKTKLGMLPISGLIWQEIARRYILALMSMEGNLEPTKIASCVRWSIFSCLHGDGGILCGSLTGTATFEGDAVKTRFSVWEDVRRNSCPNIEEKAVHRLSDLINRQCRIVLRHVVAADENRVFCTLVGRTILNPNDNDEGLLGYPAMVSRPLDFRTIDARFGAGAYGGSHEAFSVA